MENKEILEVNNDNESTFDMKFKFADQEGPLDLLLQLIKKSKLEIEDVNLADICDQYLEMVSNLQHLDMEMTSDFIVLASELIEIKSRRLLPRSEENLEPEEDPDYILKMRLKEYAMLKESSEKLKMLENNDRFYKAPEKEANKFRIVLKDMQLENLLDAFVNIMHKVSVSEEENEVKQVEKEKFTVEQKIASIKDSLLLNKKVMFSELFGQTISKNELVTTFMALLELLKLQEIKVKQGEMFGDIEIEKCEEING